MSLPLGQAKRFLVRLEDTRRLRLEDAFNSCKTSTVQRFVQVFSFWRDIPWRICAIGVCLFDTLQDDTSTTQVCTGIKTICKRNPGSMGSCRRKSQGKWGVFFAIQTSLENLLAYMVYWASSGGDVVNMPPQLSQALMRYCTALTVMQSLETTHHYLHKKISFGRAIPPS